VETDNQGVNSRSIPESFFNSASRHSDRTAFEYYRNGWRKISYSEASGQVTRLLGILKTEGIKQSDRVLITARNSPAWCISYLAVSSAGAVVVPVDPELTADEMRNIMVDASISFVLHDSYSENKTREAASGSHIKHINIDELATDPLTENKPEGLHSGSLQPVTSEDIASIIYTSGTTGSPKGVILTHGNFLSDVDSVIKAEFINQYDVILSILPLHHTYSFMTTFLLPILIGATIVYPHELKGNGLLRTVRERGVTILIGVPRLLELFRNRIISRISEVAVLGGPLLRLPRVLFLLRKITGINAGRQIFSSVHKRFGRQFRFFTSGGARLEPETMEELEGIGFTVLEGYGLTETSPIVAFNTPEKRKPGSVGRPLPSVDIKIASDGEILIKGPMVMKGYYNNPEETEKVLRNGWLYTGDTGYVDDEGFLYITGRKKEVIILSSGKSIYPEDVERHYLTVPLIKEICVVSRNNGIGAVVVPDLEKAKEMKVGNIYEYLKWEVNSISSKIPSYMRLKWFRLLNTPLPRTPLGKLRRFMVQNLLEEKGREDKHIDEGLVHDEVSAGVVASIRDVVADDIPVSGSDSLEMDIGLDSLQRIELIGALEKHFSIKLDEDFTHDTLSVGELIEKIRKTLDEETREMPGDFNLLEEVEEVKESVERLLKLNLFERMFYILSLFLIKLLCRIYFRIEARGIEKIPEPPFIITPNHSSYLDSFLLASVIPYRTMKDIYFQGASSFFRTPLMRWFAHTANVIPTDPDSSLLRALRTSAHVLRGKKNLCIFPEGGRTFTGEVMEFKKGVGILALKLGVRVVPVHIKGTFRSLPRGKRFPKPVKIHIAFGRPIKPAADETTDDPYKEFADRVREEVVRLNEFPGN
jgi:long-chain acyl-CoA synthetase